MSRIPKSSSRELCPEGAHNSALVNIIDLGTQDGGEYGPKHKIQLAYELVDEKTTDGKAMVAYRQYTFSASAKGNLMKDIRAAWGIKDSDVEMDELLGKACMVTIEHKETDNGTFANITNVGMLPKGVKPRKATEPLRSLYLDDSFDQEVYDALPDFLKEKIAGSPEYAAVMSPKLKKEKALPPAKSNGKAVKGKK